MGNTLDAKDIKILNAGQQVKKVILQEYLTVEAFYKQNNITNPSLKSIKCYLSSNNISETFQILIVKLLKKNWSDIVKTEVEQIQLLVDQVTKNINYYIKDSDLITLEKLKNISKPYTTFYSTMYRNIGLYFYNTFRYSDAVACLLFAIELLNNNLSEYNLIIQFYIDLLTICFREREFSKTRKLHTDIDIIINNHPDINSIILYKLWYVLGQLYRNGVEETDNLIAQTMFYRALKLSNTNIEKGNTYLQIGLTYKKDKNYNNAIKYYKLAQETYEKNDNIRQGIVLNNLADLYKTMGEKNLALLSIEEALFLINNEVVTDKKLIFLTTKLEIVLDSKERNNLIKKIEYILLSDINSFNKKFIIETIDTMINIVENNNDQKNIKSLIFIIDKIINNFTHSDNQSNYIHTNFIQLLENHRNKLIYINNKMIGGDKIEECY